MENLLRISKADNLPLKKQLFINGTTLENSLRFSLKFLVPYSSTSTGWSNLLTLPGDIKGRPWGGRAGVKPSPIP
jgi:hypothetical protein